MKTIAFFNNKSGAGKTALVYHLAWLYADLGIKVLVADLDPQANLSAMFLEEERLVRLWDDGGQNTVTDCLQPLIDRTGDIATPYVEHVTPTIGLVAGNLALSRFEDLLSESWVKCLDGDAAAFRITTAFHRIVRLADRRGAGGLAIGSGFALPAGPSQSWPDTARMANGVAKTVGRTADQFGN